MFYSHDYLRRNGRFGLVWLAATQSRVLSRREVTAVQVSVTVNDIMQHFPGQLDPGLLRRPRRFSLYLSSQLMFGSVKILHKQWDYLLTDLSSLLRRFHIDVSPTNEIDLILVRQDPVTLESCVPTGIRDKFYDPFFGVFKDNITDVEALLESWDQDYVEREKLVLGAGQAAAFKAEIGSPATSVSDPREIQIPDVQNLTLSSVIPGEQDLPNLDHSHLALIQGGDQFIDVSIEELVNIGALTRPTELQESLPGDPHMFARPVRPVEETPAVKTGRELPSTPQKATRKRHRVPHRDEDHNGQEDVEKDSGQTQALDGVETGPPDQTAASADGAAAQQAPIDQEQVRVELFTSPAMHQSQTQLVVPSPEPALQVSHDWTQKHPRLHLTPIQPAPSPVRKRLPHKLIIDDTLQLSRLYLKNSISDTSDIRVPFEKVLADPHKAETDFLKVPGSQAVRNFRRDKLWTRNLKLGLRLTEAVRDDGILSDLSPLSPVPKRKRSLSDYRTPAKLPSSETMTPHKGSMEKGRDVSALLTSNRSIESSKSAVGQVSDDSIANVSADLQQPISVHDQSLEQSNLAPVPEELEQILSPGPLPAQVPSLNQSKTLVRQEESKLFSLLRESSQEGDWTTFRAICPPLTTSKLVAIRMFQEICHQVGIGALRVRQDEPYGEIYIWATHPSGLEA